jgi:DNA-binding CsgD family transcriptional regulator
VQAIRLVARGAVWVDQKVIQLLAELGYQRSGSPLTDGDERVLLGIIGGLTNRKIGENIGLSERNVKSVVHRFFRRAGVRKRSQLVRMPSRRFAPEPRSASNRYIRGSRGPPETALREVDWSLECCQDVYTGVHGRQGSGLDVLLQVARSDDDYVTGAQLKIAGFSRHNFA